MATGQPRWQQADDADRVHRLLELSDQAAAGTGPAPRRNPDSSRRLVEAGSVYLLSNGTDDLAMITVSSDDPTAEGEQYFPPTPQPRYMRRLAVHPDHQGNGTLLAMQAVQQAIRVARELGGTALRCETNPTNEAVMRLLALQGFLVCSPSLGPAETPHILLWRTV